MKIVIGGYYGVPRQELDVEQVTVVADDGKHMFGIIAGKDEHSIEIRGLDVFRVGGTLYCERLAVLPHASNSITVAAREWE